MLVVALIQNAGLLLAMVVVFDYFSARRDAIATPFRKALAGIAIGAIGVAMIVISVPFEHGIMFDTRSVLLGVSGLFLGFWPTSVAMAMVAMFRLMLGGDGMPPGVSVILASGAIGILWRRMRTRPVEEISWRELYALGIAIHLVMLGLMFTLPPDPALRVLRSLAVPVMIVHPLATVMLGSLFAQRLRNYRVRKDLAESESRFRLLAENASDMIFRFDFLPVRKFVYVSPSSVNLTGYSPEEYYADPELVFRTVHPEDRRLLEEGASRGGANGPRVMRWIRKDGAIIWAEQRTNPVFDPDGQMVAIEGISRDVTENHQAAERLRLALKGARQGLYDLDVRTGEAAVSEEYARMLGYEPSTFQESNAHWLARVHPDDRERVSSAYQDYVEGRTTEYRSEFRSRTRTGEWIWILSLGSIVARDAAGTPLRMLGTHTDVTALKSAEEKTRAAQAAMSQLLEEAERSRESLLILVEEQKATERQRKNAESELRRLTQILEASQAAARVGGWDLDLVENTLFWTEETYRIHDTSPAEYSPTLESAIAFFSQESIPLLEEVLRDARENGVARDAELQLITSRGNRKWVQFTPTITVERGRTSRIACAIQDITARKKEEKELLELTAQLHQAQKLESLGSLASGVAHDINNVLAAIMSSASASRPRLEDADPLARSLDTIISACLRGRSVVRSLLYFARSEFGSRGPVGLNDIVREIVELLESTTLKRVRFAMSLQETLPNIAGDRAALGHAVMNLCINSLDAMPEGGTVTITTREAANGHVEISVRDTGSGMSPETCAKAIEPFFTTKPLGEGTGLGLAMVYGTIKAHEGTLEILSAPGEGTTVVLRFPPCPVARDAGAGHTAALATRTHAGTVRTLLVDDDELIREGVGALLEISGHQMHLAASGAEAIRLLSDGLEVDLVLLDMNMPGLTGPETLPRLLEIRPGLSVLLCSGHRDDEMAQLTGSPNILSIQKPFTLEELEAKLSELGLKQEP